VKRNYLLALVMSLILFVSSCAFLDSVLLNDDGNVKSDVTKIVDGVGAGGAAVGAVGIPYGFVVSGIASAFGGIAATYAKMRKTTKASDDKAVQTQAVITAIVDAVKATRDVKLEPEGETVEQMIKRLVKEKLQDKDIYRIGKTIIDEAKRSN